VGKKRGVLLLEKIVHEYCVVSFVITLSAKCILVMGEVYSFVLVTWVSIIGYSILCVLYE
jgi:hypothetical protein